MSLDRTSSTIDKLAAARFKKLDYVLAETLGGEPEFSDDLVEGLIGRMSMAVIYGDSNSGKTFLAIDLAASVARSIEWMGRRTEPGMVVYLATENPASVRNRLRAYMKHYDVEVPNFVIVNSPVNLFNEDADTSKVVALIQQLEREHGIKCELVIGDTLARMSAGANENSGEDMTIVLQNLDQIKDLTRSTVLMIHHTGKNAAMGMRGWSGMRAAIDTELEVTGGEGGAGRVMEVTKQRDMGGKGDRIGFRLDPVALGVGKWGKEQTSCVVVPAEAPLKASRTLKLGDTQQAVIALLRGAGRNMRGPEIASALEPQGLSRGSVNGAIARLVKEEILERSGGVIHLNGI